MPTYGYKCEQGHTFEVLQRMSDEPVETCETCDAPVQRMLFPVAVHFKGKGFYSTDYGSKRRNRELKDAAEGEGKYEKGDGGSDSSSTKDGDSSTDSSKGEGKGKGDGKGESKGESTKKAASADA